MASSEARKGNAVSMFSPACPKNLPGMEDRKHSGTGSQYQRGLCSEGNLEAATSIGFQHVGFRPWLHNVVLMIATCQSRRTLGLAS